MYRVLLVDDEILVRDAMRENVDWHGLGFELVRDCQNGKDAIEYLEQNQVHVILTDINMPYVDGMELSRYAFENHPETEIIIFSGFSEFEYAKKAIQYQVSEYLLKPITAFELSAVLKKIREKLDNRYREEEKLTVLQNTSREYNKNAGIFRSRALNDLVMGNKKPEDSLRELAGMGIDFQSECYRLAALDMDIYSELYEPDFEKKQESALMAFVALNISTEILQNENCGIAYQEGDHRIRWILWGSATQRFIEKSSSICHRIREEINKALGMELSVGLGICVNEPTQLYYSWKSAKEALSLRYVIGGNRILDMENLQINQPVSFYTETEKLLESVRKHDFDDSVNVLDGITEKMREACLEKSQVTLLLLEVIKAVGTVQRQSGAMEERVQSEQNHFLEQVTKVRTLTAAITEVREYVRSVIDGMEEVNDTKGKRTALIAMDYIEKKYSEASFNLNEICSYLAISTSHFSTIFKEATGVTFMEALTRVRMQKAKELLRHTSLKNYEIADRVGFSDPHYFSIAFKKMTGKSPTEYAKEVRKDG
ncbi:MAG: response regulator [Eubacteriales bacterium]|nr:response regulator [Eubacteriales bacterium]